MAKIIVDRKQNRQKKRKKILESSSIKIEVQIRGSIEGSEKELLRWLGRKNKAGPKRERM